MNCFVYRILSLATQMEIYSLYAIQKIWSGIRLIKSRFIWYHTFQYCLEMFKLNKHAKCLNFAINY